MNDYTTRNEFRVLRVVYHLGFYRATVGICEGMQKRTRSAEAIGPTVEQAIENAFVKACKEKSNG
jgi:hypothetical protein